MESKCIDYNKKITEEFPCFFFWFLMDKGEIFDFKEDNHGIDCIYGLPLPVVEAIVDGIKDELTGNYMDELPTEDMCHVKIKVAGIEYFGGQYSNDACAYEVYPGYWYGIEILETTHYPSKRESEK